MTRKDSEKESERPHYYSQFWLDIAAGRRVIGGPRPEENGEGGEAEAEAPEPVLPRRSGRATASAADGYRETRSAPIAEPEPEPEEEEVVEPEYEEMDAENEVDDLELPNIVVDDETEGLDVAEELTEAEPAEEEEEFFEDEVEEEEEEEEEEETWGPGRGRKKPKPGRQVKPPKKPRRDTRRGY